MNSRDYKEFAPGNYYHIYNRGNGKMNIFRDEEDFNFFLFRLEENLFPIQNSGNPEERHLQKMKLQQKYPNRYIRSDLPENSFEVISYCLMPNHFHLIIKQNSDIPVSKLMLKICTGFSKYFNRKYDSVGSVFQDRFKAVHVGNDDYLLWLSAYIHLNPLKAGLVRNLNDYQFSSYFDYVGARKSRLCSTDFILSALNDEKGTYLDFLKSSHAIMHEKEEFNGLFLDNQ
jgi:putative transposase